VPTPEGWLTIEEEYAARQRARAKRVAGVAPEDVSADDLPMQVSMTLGEWRSVLEEDGPARQKLRDMVESHVRMADDIR
jgi:hypothetical protein